MKNLMRRLYRQTMNLQGYVNTWYGRAGWDPVYLRQALEEIRGTIRLVEDSL